MRYAFPTDKIVLFSYFGILISVGTTCLLLPVCYNNANPVPFIDALFKTVSAVCVTGLSTVDMAVYSRIGLIVIAFLIELGGLGIISFVSIYFALPKRKISLVNRRMVRDFFTEEVENNPRTIVSAIILFALGIQILGALGLFFVFSHHNVSSPLFAAVFHSISAFCNAGFSIFSDGLEPFRYVPSVNIIIMLLIITGGLGFTVMKNIYQCVRYRKRLSLHTKLVVTLTIVLIFSGTIVYFFTNTSALWGSSSWGQQLLASLFQSVTTRTAGFNTINQSELSPASQVYTVFLMFIGGSPGSVAGGIKTTTFFIVLLYVMKGKYRKQGLPVFSRHITQETTEKALDIALKSVLIVFCAVFCLLITEHRLFASGSVTISEIVFETVSAFATVGLSQGITAQLSTGGKLILIITMFIGRTGIFAMAVAIAGNAKERIVEYPDESVLVG